MSGQWGAMPLVYSEEGCDMMGSLSGLTMESGQRVNAVGRPKPGGGQEGTEKVLGRGLNGPR